MDSDEDFIIISLLLSEDEIIRQKRNKRKRKWIHEICKTRMIDGEFHTLFKNLRQDESKFYQYFRMGYQKFYELNLIKPDLLRCNTRFRNSIGPDERLAVTLRFLATGDSFKTIAFSYRLGHTTVREIVHSTCDAIWKILSSIVMPPPTEESLIAIEKDFRTRWNFPNCVGAIDGKHIVIEAPPNTGSLYFNYKKTFSIVLMALVDANCKFIAVDVGAFGRNSDGGIFSNSNMGKAIVNGIFKFPPNKILLGTGDLLPHVIVGDEAFPLHKHVMRPYPGSQIKNDETKKNFNYRLSRARRISENAFGILTQKFRIFKRRLQMKPEHVDKVVLAACCLHNFIKNKNTITDEISTNSVSEIISNFQNLGHIGGNATNEAMYIRDKFKSYFMTNEGTVEWQTTYVRTGLRNV